MDIMDVQKKVIKILSGFLKKGYQDFVSINIGNYYIKGLVIKDNKAADYFIIENKNLPDVLSQIWKDKRIETSQVKLTLKSPSSLVRYFSFPKMEEKRIREALFYELDKHIPFPSQEVYFDFYALKTINPNELFLLVAAVKKDFLDPILTAFKGKNLRVSQVSLDSVSLVNLFFDVYPQEKENNICLLDIGHSFSSLTIIDKGCPFLTRDLEFSARSIFSVVSNIKGIGEQSAQEWFFSLKDHDEFFQLISSHIRNLCKEVKNSFDYFELNKASRIDKMYISGGISYVKNLESIFKENLEIETVALNEFKNIEIGFEQEQFNLYKNAFAPAFGLVV